MNKLPDLSHLTDEQRKQLILDKLNDAIAHIMACPPDEQAAWGKTLISSAINIPLHAAMVTGDVTGSEKLPLDKAIFTAANRAVVHAIEGLRKSPKYTITSSLRELFNNGVV